MRLNGRPSRVVFLRWAGVILAITLVIGWFHWRGRPGPDLVVYGATPQGVMAAVTAARQGERVLLVEPSSGIGGQLTQAWLATLDMSIDTLGNPLAQGLFHEFFRGLHRQNSFDVPEAQGLLNGLLHSAGVEVRLDTDVAEVRVDAGRVTSLTLRGPEGIRSLSVRALIDASDTAKVAALAGARFTVGREDTGLDQAQMAATLVFRILGADLPQLAARVHQEHGREDGQKNRSLSGLVTLTDGYTPSDPNRYFLRGFNASVQQDGSLLVNALLIYGVDGTSEASVGQAYSDGAREARRVVQYLHDRFPDAFGHAAFGGVAPRLYLRETRHLLGVNRLTASDVLYGRRFPDAVAVNAYALDGQAYVPGQGAFLLGTPRPYEVPLGALMSPGLRNLLVVSQASSFDSVAAFSARVVPLQMTLGEAAGQASVLSHYLDVDFVDLDRTRLLTSLLRGLLRVHHGRVDAPELPGTPPCQDARQRGAREAESLLRAGLMSAPYYYVGCLYLTQPETAAVFLHDLQHAGSNTQNAQFKHLRASLSSGEILTVERARTLLASLGLSTTDALLSHGPTTRPLTRGEAAELRWSLRVGAVLAEGIKGNTCLLARPAERALDGPPEAPLMCP
ncbi:FAD-dependent oxidoreductase (plasmid) [Deinococcus radiomollis]|uniref:FAD-dependent oxidoreductase n=1 Tax=Deinococcus radiomollis TaxID=468916 RepID=UPI00389153D2